MFSRADDSDISVSADMYPPEQSLIPSLNGIRAISVLLVMISHAGYANVVPGGLGVTIFFFLSGFLITSLFIAEQATFGRISIPKFYLRRAFRLFPPLVLTISVACFLVIVGLLPGKITVPGLISQFLYFANYYGIAVDPSGATIPAGTGILWSLAIEEHFYIFYPALLVAMIRYIRNTDVIIFILAIFCVIILFWRLYLVLHGAHELRIYYATDTRIDSIIFGCMLAIGWTRSSGRALLTQTRTSSLKQMSVRQWLLLSLAAAVLLATLIIRGEFFRDTFRYTLQGIALVPIFYYSIIYNSNVIFRNLNSRWINTLGVYSYFIYLIHFVLINVLLYTRFWLFNYSIMLFFATLTLSLIYAFLLDVVVDPYFRQLRLRLRQSAPHKIKAAGSEAFS